MTAARARALRAAGVIALVALLCWFGRGVDWRSVVAAARSADPALLAAALALNLLSLSLKGVRWWVFLRPLGAARISMVLRATFAGASLNNLVVAQGGEGARVVLVSRAAGIPSGGVLAALAVERVLDLLSYLALLVMGAWLLDLPPHIARWRAMAAGVLGLAVVALLVAGVLARRHPRIARHPGASPGMRLLTYLRGTLGDAALITTPSRLALGALLSAGAWALQVATYHLTARAAHLPLSLSGSVAALLAVGLSFLVRATPGNVGVFQMVYAVTAASFGVAEGPAVATALLIQAVQVIPTVALGSLVAPGLLRVRPPSS